MRKEINFYFENWRNIWKLVASPIHDHVHVNRENSIYARADTFSFNPRHQRLCNGNLWLIRRSSLFVCWRRFASRSGRATARRKNKWTGFGFVGSLRLVLKWQQNKKKRRQKRFEIVLHTGSATLQRGVNSGGKFTSDNILIFSKSI